MRGPWLSAERRRSEDNQRRESIASSRHRFSAAALRPESYSTEHSQIRRLSRHNFPIHHVREKTQELRRAVVRLSVGYCRTHLAALAAQVIVRPRSDLSIHHGWAA